MNLYTDPHVTLIMRQMADGLAAFNAKAEAAISQSTQFGAPAPVQPKQPGATISTDEAPGCSRITGEA